MDFKTHITQDNQTTLQKLLATGPLRLLLAGMFFLFGVARPSVYEVRSAPRPLSRSLQRKRDRRWRMARQNYRDTSHLRAFMPKGISRTQYLERSTKLSPMGRFQIYDWLYYRWEFWRIGAIAKRCRAPQGAAGPVSDTIPLGLSAAHLGPD